MMKRCRRNGLKTAIAYPPRRSFAARRNTGAAVRRKSQSAARRSRTGALVVEFDPSWRVKKRHCEITCAFARTQKRQKGLKMACKARVFDQIWVIMHQIQG